jgi:hypothetical protein
MGKSISLKINVNHQSMGLGFQLALKKSQTISPCEPPSRFKLASGSTMWSIFGSGVTSKDQETTGHGTFLC